MSELHPDIQRLIVKALVSGRNPKDFKDPLDFEELVARAGGLFKGPTSVTEREDQQRCLARMMRASKTLYQLCKIELYRECFIADIDTFAQDIKTNPRKIELLNHITTLRLYQPIRNILTDPTYD